MLNRQFYFLDQIFPKIVFSIQNIKMEQHHRIQDIRINLDAKFHLKQTFLNFFLPNFPKNRRNYLVYHK